jgi:membrane protein implicated in regulation of membrane protease activity
MQEGGNYSFLKGWNSVGLFLLGLIALGASLVSMLSLFLQLGATFIQWIQMDNNWMLLCIFVIIFLYLLIIVKSWNYQNEQAKQKLKEGEEY